jgi:hypothetical protein
VDEQEDLFLKLADGKVSREYLSEWLQQRLGPDKESA